MASSTRAERAAARATWTIERHQLGDDGDELLRALSPGACVAMVWAMTLDAWALSGRAIPDYARAEAPGQIIRSRRA